MVDGDGGAAVQDPISQQTTVSLNTNNEQPAGAENKDGFSIPDAYKDKPYLKDVKSLDDVYKKLDGAESVMGRQVKFPTDQSTDEERIAFYKSAGMPEKSEDYVFEKFGEQERDIDVDNKFKAIFHKHGLSGKAATGMQKDVELLVAETMEAKKVIDDKTFNELTSKVLGEKADDILASGKKLIEENIPEELSEHFKGLSNGALVILTSVLDSVKKKYISEDTITEGDSVPGVSGEAALREKALELMNHPAYKNAMHKDYDKINAEIKEIYKQVGKITK